MVKLYILRHAQSEVNLLKDKTMEEFNLTSNSDKIFIKVYKLIKSEILLDATLTELGKAQCEISFYQNASKFENVGSIFHIKLLFFNLAMNPLFPKSNILTFPILYEFIICSTILTSPPL